VRPVRLRNRGKYFVVDLVVISAFLVAMTALLWMIHHQFDEHFAQSALVGILGLVLGIVIAVILTPFTAEENKQWSNLTSAVVGAIAGYGIGIINDSVGYVFKGAHLLTDPLLGVRTAVFLCCTLFSLVYGFSYRRYYVSADLTLEDDPDQDAARQNSGTSATSRTDPIPAATGGTKESRPSSD
jgi:hypothetical protein